ncbi:MAG: septal ring lytic transglycosylase RlpA family protein [Gammaproteobacteria bacterium]|nr:septal ring lytic transglycosylase RlpA family protein [Gammaproteobacteria bacterium]
MRIKPWVIGCLLGLLGIAYADGPPMLDRDISGLKDANPQPLPYNAYANQPIYAVNGQTYTLIPSTHGYTTTGTASWYGQQFAEHLTASGEPYDMFAMTAASKVLPIPTFIKVTNLENGRSIVVKVNDRGPFHSERILDLSYAAAKRLGMLQKGTAKVRITALETPYNAQLTAYYLQVATFRNLENATHLAQTLKTILVAPVAINTVRSKPDALYSVRVGPFINMNKAQSLYRQLTQAGLSPGILVAA